MTKWATRTCGWRSWARGLGTAILLCSAALLVFTGTSAATTIGDDLHIPFDGPFSYGFVNDGTDFDELPPDYMFGPELAFLPAGASELESSDGEPFVLEIIDDQRLTLSAAGDDFYREQVTWTLENGTGGTLDHVLLVLATLAGPPQYPDYPEYRSSEISVDVLPSLSDPLSVVYYDSGNLEYYFLAVLIEDLGTDPSDALVVSFTYEINLALVDLIDGQTPAFGVAAVIMPEPGPSLLAAIALVGLWVFGRPVGGLGGGA